MKKLTYWLMLYQLKRAEESVKKETNFIVLKALRHRVHIYKGAIIFLKN